MKKPSAPVVVTDKPPTRSSPDGRYRVRTGETYEVIRGLVLRVVE